MSHRRRRVLDWMIATVLWVFLFKKPLMFHCFGLREDCLMNEARKDQKEDRAEQHAEKTKCHVTIVTDHNIHSSITPAWKYMERS